jgi:hypothetical protein
MTGENATYTERRELVGAGWEPKQAARVSAGAA